MDVVKTTGKSLWRFQSALAAIPLRAVSTPAELTPNQSRLLNARGLSVLFRTSLAWVHWLMQRRYCIIKGAPKSC